MTKVILNRLQAEYEATDISIEDLVTKYSLDLADVKGYKKWTKNLLNPQTRGEKSKHLNTHIDIVAQADTIVVDETPLQMKDTRPEALNTDTVVRTMTPKIAMDIIVDASKDIQEGKVPHLPQVLKEGFDGLRRLDTKMQKQADRLIDKIDSFIDDVEDSKSLKELINSHTDLRNTYFNQKNTMVNIINGDLTQTNNTQNNLASFIAEVEDDC